MLKLDDAASGRLRWMASLLLIVLGVFAWRVLQSESTPCKTTSKLKKKSKKKAKKKPQPVLVTQSDNTTQTQIQTETTQTQTTQTQNPPLQPPPPPPQEEEEEEATSDEDDDVGLKASKVLAKRVFKQPTVPIGGGKLLASASDSAPTSKFAMNQRVMARFDAHTEWFPGTIREVKRGDRYTVLYDDGAIEHNVPSALIQDLVAFKAASATSSEQTSENQQPADQPQEPSQHQPPPHPPHPEITTEEESEDDGWQLVQHKPKSAKQPPHQLEPSEEPELTKRQRQNQRKKQRQKELKEAVRAQAQEHGLHARWGGDKNKYTYVPPPSKP